MVEYSTCARQELRVRQNFFQYDILWLILYILSIFKILISFKSIAIDAFEYWIFSWKIQKKLKFFKIFQIAKFLEKIEFSKKNFKLHIALKNSLFKLWPNKKKIATRFYHEDHISKKFLARAHFRARRAKSFFVVKVKKNHGFLAQMVEYSTGARQNFFHHHILH